LALEAGGDGAVVVEFVAVENLDGGRALEFVIHRLVDTRHTARSKAAGDAIVAQLLADQAVFDAVRALILIGHTQPGCPPAHQLSSLGMIPSSRAWSKSIGPPLRSFLLAMSASFSGSNKSSAALSSRLSSVSKMLISRS